MRTKLVAIVLVLALVMLLVPPWKMRVDRIWGSYGHQYHYTFVGYLPFWMEPQHTPEAHLETGTPSIDFERLGLQFAALGVVLVGVLLLTRKKPEHESILLNQRTTHSMSGTTLGRERPIEPDADLRGDEPKPPVPPPLPEQGLGACDQHGKSSFSKSQVQWHTWIIVLAFISLVVMSLIAVSSFTNTHNDDYQFANVYNDDYQRPFQPPAGVENIALGKLVSSSDEEPIIGELRMITDGDKEENNYVELGPFLQHITIDLEADYDIHAIVVWHCHKDDRMYLGMICQAAQNADFNIGVQTLFNNDYDNSAGYGIGRDQHYRETREGKLIRTKGIKARYIRLFSDGSTANDLNHYTEVEVYGLPVEVKVENKRRSLAELAGLSRQYADWQTVSLPETLSFQIPPTLEIQKGVIKQLGTEMREQLFEDIIEGEQSSDRIVAQPKGINDLNPAALKRYCRIIVETVRGAKGDYFKLNEPLKASAEELREIGARFKSQIEAGSPAISSGGMKMTILSWSPAKIVTINGVGMLLITYTRSMNDGPPAIVQMYHVQNNDCLHTITISYRESESDLWATDLEKVIQTFEFIKH